MRSSADVHVYYAAHDLESVRDTAAAILFAGTLIKASGESAGVDVLVYVGAAPTNQPLVPATSTRQRTPRSTLLTRRLN